VLRILPGIVWVFGRKALPKGSPADKYQRYANEKEKPEPDFDQQRFFPHAWTNGTRRGSAIEIFHL
jgi:hypothetical protein